MHTIDCRPEQPIKANESMFLKLSGKTTSARLSQPEKVLGYIYHEPSGMVIEVNERHLANAPLPIFVMPLGMSIELKLTQS